MLYSPKVIIPTASSSLRYILRCSTPCVLCYRRLSLLDIWCDRDIGLWLDLELSGGIWAAPKF